MRNMQDRLDRSRKSILWVRDHAPRIQRVLERPEGEHAELLEAVHHLIALNEYRNRAIGWATEEEWRTNHDFVYRRSREVEWRQAILAHLGKLDETARERNRLDIAQEIDTAIRETESIPEQEKSLYRARREWGRLIVSSTREAYDLGAANQIEDIARSGGQSLRVYLDFLCDDRYAAPMGDFMLQAAQRAAISAHFGTAVCDHYAYYAMTEAYRLLPGTHVAVVAYAERHVGLVIGPVNHDESVHVDAWTPRRSVTSLKNYGMRAIQTGRVLGQGVADGRNLRQEVQPYIYPLPDRPPTVPPIAVTEAIELVRSLDTTIPHLSTKVFYITRGSNDHNSDSDEDEVPARGHALSEEAFEANAENGFLMQSKEMQGGALTTAREPETSVVAAMRTAPSSSTTPRSPVSSPVPRTGSGTHTAAPRRMHHR
jgi:hypothetical protein